MMSIAIANGMELHKVEHSVEGTRGGTHTGAPLAEKQNAVQDVLVQVGVERAPQDFWHVHKQLLLVLQVLLVLEIEVEPRKNVALHVLPRYQYYYC